VQQAPIIVQQPTNNGSANDDATMQDVATKKLADDPDMASISVSITNARAVLTGTVNSAATKAKAERVIKSVRGVKSVDNQIVISG
jgi:hyperosmotically inducible protein